MIRRMIRILKKCLGTKCAPNGKTMKKERTGTTMQTRLTLQRLETYLMNKYDFRFNVLTEQAEYRGKDGGDFLQVNQRVMNTLCLEAQSSGIACWDRDVSRLLCSKKIADFHPFRSYMDHLPGIGRDRQGFRTGTKNFGYPSVDRRIPPLDAGYDGPMDGNAPAMCQCNGSLTDKYQAGTMQVHFLFHLATGRTTALLYRQVRHHQ